MTREELAAALEPLARKYFADSELTISDSLSAGNVEGWSSLSFMQFLTAVEEQYSFKFKMMELLTLRNMGAVIDATLKHCNQ